MDRNLTSANASTDINVGAKARTNADPNRDPRTPAVADVPITRRTAGLLAGAGMLGASAALGGCASASNDGGATDDGATDGADSSPQTVLDPEQANEQQMHVLLANMSVEQKVAQLFFVRPESVFPADPVTAAGDASRAAYGELPVGGICYFGKNLLDADQTKPMLASVAQFGRDSVGAAPFIAVDEEGGTVARIAGNAAFGVDDVGDAADIGATGEADRAREAAATIAAYLSDLGFNTNFTPVADIASNPQSDTMRRRSFGTTAEAVSPMVEAAVGAYVTAGLACSPRHFPGIGAVLGDSETELIYTQKTVEQMAEAELVPFERAIAAGAQFVMVGHLACPAVNGDDTPASLSKSIVTDCLRDRLGFGGIAISDSLEMGAVVDDYPAADIGVKALLAGQDMILMPADLGATYQGVLDAVADGTISGERLDASVERILRIKASLGLLA